MRFLLATLFRAEYRQLVADSGGLHAIEPFTVECSECGALCLADYGIDDEP